MRSNMSKSESCEITFRHGIEKRALGGKLAMPAEEVANAAKLWLRSSELVGEICGRC
jgi:hypothetical protein